MPREFYPVFLMNLALFSLFIPWSIFKYVIRNENQGEKKTWELKSHDILPFKEVGWESVVSCTLQGSEF